MRSTHSLAVVDTAFQPGAISTQRQAANDDQLVEIWLHGRSVHTQRAYAADAERFRVFFGKPLPTVTLADLQSFSDSLGKLAPATRARILSSVKSLIGFGHRLGYLPFDVGSALRLPTQKNTLAERIISESDVHRMVDREPNPRNRAILRLLYAAGVRVSELTGLCWRDLQARGDGGQITAYGKGGKTRAVLLPAGIWCDLVGLRGDAPIESPVFISRKGGALDPSQVWRIVRAASKRAGIDAPVSPHFMRHAHASHALDRGAPIHLVMATLGHASVATTGRYLHVRPTESSARYLMEL